MIKTLLVASLLITGTIFSQEFIPTQPPLNQYAPIWESSPFNREVVKPVTQQISSTFGKNLTLEGVSHDDDGPIVYIQNLADKQFLVVTKTKSDAHPYTIVGAEESNDMRETTVTITNGQEVAEIGFKDGLMTQAIAQPIRQNTSQNTQQRQQAGNVSATAATNNQNQVPSGLPASQESAPANGGNSANSGNSPQEGQSETQRRRRILLPTRSQN